MDSDFYKQLIDESLLGYAYHKIVCDDYGVPCNYEYIEVNTAFEKYTGLRSSNIIGKRVTEVLPDIRKDKFDWIYFCGDIAINGGKKVVKRFSEALKRWYKVNIYSPKKYYFITYIIDVSHEMSEIAKMKKMAEVSEDFLQVVEQKIDYQKISDDFMKICSAKYATFSLFEEDGKSFTTIAVCGEKGLIKEISKLLNFKVNGKKWVYNKAMSDIVKVGTITRFQSLRAFVGKIIPVPLVTFIEKTFNIGEIIYIKILRNNIMLGNFTLFMDKAVKFDKDTLAELYTRQLGMVISRKRAEEELLYLSYHDYLTGLYNRRYFEEESVRIDIERNLPITIVMGDVNGLKLINDTFGHVMGDKLLSKVADILKSQCRDGDTIARLSGDEFVIIFPKTDALAAEEIIKHIMDLSLSEKVGAIDISISFGYETKNDMEEDIKNILKNAEDRMYKKKLFENPSMGGKTIKTIINTLHEKNKREEQHSNRVSSLCRSMGEALGLPKYANEELKIVGLLHDIGKIAIDETILNKKDKLTNDEWIEIRRHPETGYRILNTVKDMNDIANYVLYHHERWDGEGYPKGLKGEEIPLLSRIITIADSFDAMTSERSYRGALSKEVAVKELQKNSGTQFDPELVKVFIEKVLKLPL